MYVLHLINQNPISFSSFILTASPPRQSYSYLHRGASTSAAGERKPPLVIVHLIAPNKTRWTEVGSTNQRPRDDETTNQDASSTDRQGGVAEEDKGGRVCKLPLLSHCFFVFCLVNFLCWF